MGRKRTISADRLLAEALVLLEDGGLGAVTMRALAARLGVDPMAAYHYFPDKNALLRAAAARAYQRLVVRVPSRAGWRRRLAALARAYLAMLVRSGELLRYVTTADAAPAAAIFDAHFRDAVAPLALRPRAYLASQHAFVDFLHGVALGGRVPWPIVERELDVVMAGIRAMSVSSAR